MVIQKTKEKILSSKKFLGSSPHDPKMGEDLTRLNQREKKKSSTLSKKNDLIL